MDSVLHCLATRLESAFGNQTIDRIPSTLMDEYGRLVESFRLLHSAKGRLMWSCRFRRLSQHKSPHGLVKVRDSSVFGNPKNTQPDSCPCADTAA